MEWRGLEDIVSATGALFLEIMEKSIYIEKKLKVFL
jgi:hypothetical protein